jgi:hypothetical protein
VEQRRVVVVVVVGVGEGGRTYQVKIEKLLILLKQLGSYFLSDLKFTINIYYVTLF